MSNARGDERPVFVADKWEDFENVLLDKTEVRKTRVVTGGYEQILDGRLCNEIVTSQKA